MRIILRIVAVAIWFAIISTLLLIWRFWRFGDLATLWASGIFGLITFLGWLLTLNVGPFAGIQLWRLRESGRKSSLFLAGCTLLYYLVTWLISRQHNVPNPKF